VFTDFIAGTDLLGWDARRQEDTAWTCPEGKYSGGSFTDG